jgi:hypothetical protein
MSNTDFLGRAIDTVKKAIENDNEGEYEKAYQLYYSALELFMLALKWEKNPRSKEMIRAKTGEYMDRAEKLKNHLASGDRKKPSALGANGKVAQGSGKGYDLYPASCYSSVDYMSAEASRIFRSQDFRADGGVQAGKRMMTATARTPTRRSSDQPSRERFYRINRTSSGRTLPVWRVQRKP